MANPLNPGVSPQGPTGPASAPMGSTGWSANVGRFGVSKWSSDTSDLDQTSKKLQQITTDIGKLDAAITKLTQKLSAMGDKASSAFGGGQQGAKGGLTTARVSGGTFGPAAAAEGLGALAFGGARLAGSINTVMGAVVSGGQPIDTMARQTNSIFGGGSSKNTVASFNGMLNTGTGDLNSAQAQLMANPMLFAQGGSAKQKNLTNFINTLQKLNPGMSAAAAAQAANSLASGPALQAMQRFVGNGKGLVNTQGGINGTNQVFSSLLQTVMGGQKLSRPQMRAMAGSSAQATKDWTMITQNNSVPGLGLGLSPQMLTELRQYAASGGNLSAAEKTMNGPALANLQKSTNKTRAVDSGEEATAGTQSAMSRAEGQFYNFINTLVKDVPGVAALGAAAASGAKNIAHLAELLGTGGVIYEGFKLLTGRGKKGGGTSGTTTGGGGGGGGDCVKLCEPVEVNCGCGTTSKKPATHSAPKAKSGGGWWHGVESWTDKYVKNPGGGLIKKIASDISKGPEGPRIPGLGDLPEILEGLGDPATGSTTTQGMTPSLAKSISAMRAANPNIQITSGHRTSAQQKTLYALKGGKGVARPGMSDHQTGHAADLGPPSQFGWIAKNASKFGLKRPDPKNEPWHVMGDPATGSSAVSVAQSFLGTPYVWGGGNAGGASTGQPGDSADPNAPNQIGLDCSGLVVAVYAKLGISMPRTSQQQAKVGTAVASLAAAQPGDLILYNEPGEGPNSHVAIYIGGGKQIAAPYTGQVVRVESVDKAHLSTIRRVLSGGNGHSVVQAAQAMVGTPSNDAANHAVGVNVGLQNTFIDQVNAGGTGGLGGSATAPPVASVSGAGAVNTGVAASGGSVAGAGAAVGGSMTAAQVLSLAMSAGLSKRAAQIATAVADVESRFRTGAIDHDANGTTDYGLWQINSIHGVGTDMFNPTAAAAKMAQMTNKGTSWGAWAPDFGSSSYGGNPVIGGKVEAAMNQLGYMGDPGGAGMGDPTAAMVSSATGTGGGVATLTRGMNPGGGRSIIVNLTNQMISFSQQEAQSMVQMVITALKDEGGLSSVSGS